MIWGKFIWLFVINIYLMVFQVSEGVLF